MTREAVKTIYELICPEWIEDSPEEVHDALAKVCEECLHLYERIDNLNEMIEPYHKAVLELNKENKKLWKQLNMKK